MTPYPISFPDNISYSNIFKQVENSNDSINFTITNVTLERSLTNTIYLTNIVHPFVTTRFLVV